MNDSRRCTARSKASGVQCKRAAILGGNVCSKHGASAPQVKAKARERVLAERAAKEFGLSFANDPDKVLAELGCIAGTRLSDLYGEDGKLLRVREMPEHVQAAIASVDAFTGNVDTGDGKSDLLVRVRLVDKLKALEVLAKHHGLSEEKVNHTGGIEISWKSSE